MRKARHRFSNAPVVIFLLLVFTTSAQPATTSTQSNSPTWFFFPGKSYDTILKEFNYSAWDGYGVGLGFHLPHWLK